MLSVRLGPGIKIHKTHQLWGEHRKESSPGQPNICGFNRSLLETMQPLNHFYSASSKHKMFSQLFKARFLLTYLTEPGTELRAMKTTICFCSHRDPSTSTDHISSSSSAQVRKPTALSSLYIKNKRKKNGLRRAFCLENPEVKYLLPL